MGIVELVKENKNKLEEIGNTLYEKVTDLYENIIDGPKGIYVLVIAYGEKDGSGKGRGQQGGGRRNIKRDPCKKGGPGYGKGGGRGRGAESRKQRLIQKYKINKIL